MPQSFLWIKNKGKNKNENTGKKKPFFFCGQKPKDCFLIFYNPSGNNE
jgi:hypothetical protein